MSEVLCRVGRMGAAKFTICWPAACKDAAFSRGWCYQVILAWLLVGLAAVTLLPRTGTVQGIACPLCSLVATLAAVAIFATYRNTDVIQSMAIGDATRTARTEQPQRTSTRIMDSPGTIVPRTDDSQNSQQQKDHAHLVSQQGTPPTAAYRLHSGASSPNATPSHTPVPHLATHQPTSQPPTLLPVITTQRTSSTAQPSKPNSSKYSSTVLSGASSPICLLTKAANSSSTCTSHSISSSSSDSSSDRDIILHVPHSPVPCIGSRRLAPSAPPEAFSPSGAAILCRRRYMRYQRNANAVIRGIGCKAHSSPPAAADAAPPADLSLPASAAAAVAAHGEGADAPLTPQTYISSCYGEAGDNATGRAVGGGCCVRVPLHLKLPHLEPQQLPPGFLAAINKALRGARHGGDVDGGSSSSSSGGGLLVVGAAVRHGCVELTLDLMERVAPHRPAGRLACITDPDGSGSGGVGRPGTTGGSPSSGGAAPQQGLESHERWLLELPALIMEALGVPPPPPPPEEGVSEPEAAVAAAAAEGASSGERGDEEGRSQQQRRRQQQQQVLVQYGGACWSLVWDSPGSQWRVVTGEEEVEEGEGEEAGGLRSHAGMQQQGSDAVLGGSGMVLGGNSGGGGGAALIGSPLAVLAAVQLAAAAAADMTCAASAGPEGDTAEAEEARQRRFLRVDLIVQGQADFEGLGAPATGDDSTPGSQPRQHHQQQQQPLRLIAKANGRSVLLPVLSATPISSPSSSFPSPVMTSSLPTDVPTDAPVPLWAVCAELDLGQLAAGRPASSPGCVVRVELWRGRRVLDAARIACLREGACVTELRALQHQLAAAAAGAEPQEWEGGEEEQGWFLVAQQQQEQEQRQEMQQLLSDLGAWLDFAAAVTDAAPAGAAVAAGSRSAGSCFQPTATSHDAGDVQQVMLNGNGDGGSGGDVSEADPLDLSEQLRGVLCKPDARRTLLGAGRHLLGHFVLH
ncbi:hypothetical protein Agub_g8630, partial [Astrephomene gubernaculifera]